MTVQEEHRGQDPCSWIAVGRRESYDSHSVIRHSEEETRSGPPMKVENHQRCNEQRIGGGGGGGGVGYASNHATQAFSNLGGVLIY